MTATLGEAAADPHQTIAELRRQLDERTAERDEALERETATSEVLQVINSSPGDLAPVFDAMLEKATRLCEATYGHLYTYDGRRYHSVAVHGEPEFIEWRRQRGPFEAGSSSAPLDRIAKGDRVVAIDAPACPSPMASPAESP
jgi:two-component system, NtrC family, sensor kinase